MTAGLSDVKRQVPSGIRTDVWTGALRLGHRATRPHDLVMVEQCWVVQVPGRHTSNFKRRDAPTLHPTICWVACSDGTGATGWQQQGKMLVNTLVDQRAQFRYGSHGCS